MNKSLIKYIAALLLFGLNGIVASHIHLMSYNIVLLRTLIGSMLLFLLYFVVERKFSFYKHPKDLFFIIISGMAMGTSWMFLYEAYSQVGVSVSSLLYYTGPVIVMVIAPVIFKEKLSLTKVVGFVIVLLGIILVNGSTPGNINSWGIICGCMSAVMYSVMVVANKKAMHITGMENSLLQLFISFVTVAVFVGIRNGGYHIQIIHGDWLWIILLGVFNTGIGCFLYFSSIGNLPVQTVAICGYLEPLSAVIFSVLLLNEKMLSVQILGAALVIGGAVYAEIAKISVNKK